MQPPSGIYVCYIHSQRCGQFLKAPPPWVLVGLIWYWVLLQPYGHMKLEKGLFLAEMACVLMIHGPNVVTNSHVGCFCRFQCTNGSIVF